MLDNFSYGQKRAPAVPAAAVTAEPMSMMLMVPGLAGLGVLKLRRKKPTPA